MDAAFNGSCSCGKSRFNVTGKPLMRAFCHCTICQRFNQAPFADITLFRFSEVAPPEEQYVNFKSHKFPPMVQRGSCSECGKPVIEYLTMPPMPKIALIPTANISDEALIPEPSLHIFYDTRVADVQDELPKYSGYLMSQMAFGNRLMGALFSQLMHHQR